MSLSAFPCTSFTLTSLGEVSGRSGRDEGEFIELRKEPREALEEGLEHDGERTTSRRFKVLLLGPSGVATLPVDFFKSANGTLAVLEMPLLAGLAGIVRVLHV